MINNMKKITHAVTIYLVLVILFSFIYWVQFIVNSSTFIIEPQMNEITNSIYQMPYEELTYKIHDNNIPFSIYEFNNFLKPVFDSISTLKHRLDSIESYEREIKTIRDSIYNLVGKSINENIDSLVHFTNKELTRRRDSIQYQIDYLSQNNINLEMDIEIANKRVVIANIELDIAKNEAHIRTNTLMNYSSFADKNLALIRDSLYNEYISNSDTIFRINELLRKLKLDAYDLTNNYHANRIKKVSYWDFLYFSLLASTSNNFGDITPNSIYVKLTICAQLLISIFFLAYIVDLVIKNLSISRRDS